MPNTATQIIKDTLIAEFLEWDYGEVLHLDSVELLDWCEQYATDNDDCYDHSWYAIMEVPSAKKDVDWVYLSEYFNDQKVDIEIENIFD
jgi:hypothetical protein